MPRGIDIFYIPNNFYMNLLIACVNSARKKHNFPPDS